MKKEDSLDTELKNYDVFEKFIALLINEKAKNNPIELDFDNVIFNLEDIRRRLDSDFPVYEYAFDYNLLKPIDFDAINIIIYHNYVVNKRLQTEDESILKKGKYISIVKQNLDAKNLNSAFEDFLVNNENFVNQKLQLFYNGYIKEAILVIIKKYLEFYETFGFSVDKIFNEKFSKYIIYLEKIISDAGRIYIKDRNIFVIILNNIVSPFFYKEENVNLFYKVLNEFVVFSKYGHVSNSDILHITRRISDKSFTKMPDYDPLRHISEEKKIQGELNFDLSITVDNVLKHKADLFLSLYLITKSLESIDGVDLEIVEIIKGSIKGKFKGKFKDIVAKEEFKTVIRNGAEIAGKMLADTSFSETNKNYSDIEKTKVEIEGLQKQIDASLSTEDLKYKNQLSVEKDILDNQKIEAELRLLSKDEKIKDLDIEMKQLEIKMKQLEYVKELSQMFSKGVITVDILNFSLNGLPIVAKENGRLEIGNVDEALK